MFAVPYYLYALLGISVPIAIHLWNRKKGKVIKVGSIKLLSESDTHKMNNIKLSEWLLMLLRIALIALLVFLISGVYFISNTLSKGETIIIVDRDYADHSIMISLIDSLDNEYDVRSFEKGFPPIEKSFNEDNQYDYWTLINHLDELEADSIIIYSPRKIINFKGQLSPLSSYISWISLPEDSPIYFINNAFLQSNDSIQLIIGSSDSYNSKFEHHIISINQKQLKGVKLDINMMDSTVSFIDDMREKIKILPISLLSIGVYADDEYKLDVPYIETAFETLENYDLVEFDISEYELNKSYDMVLWLSNKKYTVSKEGGVVLKMREDEKAKNIIKKIGLRSYELSYRMNPYFSKEHRLLQLPDAILSVLNASFPNIRRIPLKDNRSLNVSELYSLSDENDSLVKSKNATLEQRIDQWLWLLFLIFFALERGVSLKKNM